MSACILDCSASMSWIFSDEGDAASDALLDSVAQVGAIVPALWAFEVASVLLVAERRKRITSAERQQALALLGALPIQVDPRSLDRVWTETMTLAQSHDLTAYDASYLELALRHGLPLASRDKALRSAARDCGVPLSI